jgi:hypothetical protein
VGALLSVLLGAGLLLVWLALSDPRPPSRSVRNHRVADRAQQLLVRAGRIKGIDATSLMSGSLGLRYPPHQLNAAAMSTFVLVHGSWGGGWQWREVADQPRAAGHYANTPTLTALGERAQVQVGGRRHESYPAVPPDGLRARWPHVSTASPCSAIVAS